MREFDVDTVFVALIAKFNETFQAVGTIVDCDVPTSRIVDNCEVGIWLVHREIVVTWQSRNTWLVSNRIVLVTLWNLNIDFESGHVQSLLTLAAVAEQAIKAEIFIL